VTAAVHKLEKAKMCKDIPTATTSASFCFKRAIVQVFIQHLYTQTKKLLGIVYLLLINMP
jgi:hypothetical protein